MSPREVLERIAYLLEERQAPTHKVRAFRRAAATLDGLGPGELERLDRTGQLRHLPGIGTTTESVLHDALAGRTPPYLSELEEEEVTPLVGEAATLRRALRGDCHGHSDWSDGGSPIEAMARAARLVGHEYWSLTDHSARLTVAHGLDAERLGKQLEVVGALNETLEKEGRGFRVLTGMEVDILEDGSLDMDEAVLALLDVVVASVHSHLRMDAPAMTERMARAVSSPHVDILGHCTGRLRAGRGRPPSSFDPEAVFTACAETDTAVEINCRPERLDPPRPLLRKALEIGCRLSISTDAHAPGQLEWQRYGCERAAECGVTPSSVVNTWDADRLLAWTASHAS